MQIIVETRARPAQRSFPRTRAALLDVRPAMDRLSSTRTICTEVVIHRVGCLARATRTDRPGARAGGGGEQDRGLAQYRGPDHGLAVPDLQLGLQHCGSRRPRAAACRSARWCCSCLVIMINYTGVLGPASLTVVMLPFAHLVDVRGRPRAVRLCQPRDLGVARCGARPGIAVPAGRLRRRRRSEEPRAVLPLDADCCVRPLRLAVPAAVEIGPVAHHHLGHRLPGTDLRQHDQHRPNDDHGRGLSDAVPWP